MTPEHETLTSEQRFEIQHNIAVRYLARKDRVAWEAKNGTHTAVPVKKYDMGGRLVGVGNRPCAPRTTTIHEDRKRLACPR